MGAYVAPTDFQWFEYLSSRVALDEVNFWWPRPWGGQFGVLRVGEPLLFKLKTPYNMIVGGGFFELYRDLPISLAWDVFGEKNGARSLTEVYDRISSLRRDSSGPQNDPVIGCTVLTEPFFWPREFWFSEPDDWHRNIVRGKRYEFSTGSGRRLWEQVSERLRIRSSPAGVAEQPRFVVPGGYGDPLMQPRRIGQGAFRVLVMESYERQCAVTRIRAHITLDAVHIQPYADHATHDVRNALLLRSDIHRLFDAGYITITPDYRVVISARLSDDLNERESYMHLHGTRIHLPADVRLRPDPEVLRWHNERCFKDA